MLDRRSTLKLAGTALAAAGAAPGTLRAQTPSRDTIVVAQGADAYTMDPAKHSVFPTANILFHIYEALVTQDETGKFLPLLALSWSNPEPTVWEFKLRPGVKFHNGEAFDAAAVKFSFDRALDPEFKSPYRSRIAVIKSVTVVDALTVRFATEKPYPTMLSTLYEASFPALIVPPAHVKAGGPDALARRAIGTGPYRFVEWAKDERVVIEANPDYWGGAPKIRRIVWRPIPEARTRIAELKSGGIDLGGDIPPEEIAGLNSGRTRVINVNSDLLYFVGLDTLKPGPLQDKRVRQALNHAVDADAMQRTLLAGLGQRIAVTLPRNAFGYDESVQPYAYDPARAKQLLAEAGHPNGFKIQLITRQGRYLKDKEVTQAVAGYLARVGVEVELKYVEPGVWAQISERKGRDGLSFGGWSGMDADLVWYPLLFTGQYQSYYSNKELDELLIKGRSTLDDGERKAAYAAAARLIKEEAPHIPLFVPPLIYATSTRLAWVPRTDSMIDLRRAEIR
ncbi:MAG: ABC transporter substrate-binding protein [Alphaproteobacteria bacterium]|nr:ABC transporter substrate-binding protein [Alphaproteobacteria bacterium]